MDKLVLTDEQIIDHVNNIFMDLFEIEEAKLQPTANIYIDLGLDSLDTIDLLISFETKFKMKPNADEIREIVTLQDVYNLIQRYYEKI